MTNEKMLELLNDYLNDSNFKELLLLKEGLTENIRLEIEKEKGTKKKDISIMKKVIKDIESRNMNEMFYGYHEFNLDNKEYKGFTNGHFIFASDNDFGYEKAKKEINILNCFEDNCFEKNDNNIEIKVDLKDVKLFIKTHKKTYRKPYIIELDNFKVGVNPYYLQNALEFCNTDTIYITNHKSPIYIKSNDYKRLCLILPIRL